MGHGVVRCEQVNSGVPCDDERVIEQIELHVMNAQNFALAPFQHTTEQGVAHRPRREQRNCSQPSNQLTRKQRRSRRGGGDTFCVGLRF